VSLFFASHLSPLPVHDDSSHFRYETARISSLNLHPPTDHGKLLPLSVRLFRIRTMIGCDVFSCRAHHFHSNLVTTVILGLSVASQSSSPTCSRLRRVRLQAFLRSPSSSSTDISSAQSAILDPCAPRITIQVSQFSALSMPKLNSSSQFELF
jgi:hypothetical protein